MTSPPEPTDPLAALLDARIRAAVEAKVAELQKPTHVTQRAVLAVVGVPATTYLEAARAGAFASYKVQRLVYAKTADVIAWVESHKVHVGTEDKAAAATSEPRLTRAGWRRVG